MADVTFVDGMRFERPHENMPEWIRGKISIKVDDLIPFLEKHKNERGWVDIDLRKSTQGKMYLALNEYKKHQEAESTEAPDTDSEIPF